MPDTRQPWDRIKAESDPAYEAFAAYLETGSILTAYRQRPGKDKATNAPGSFTAWSTKHHWVSRRAAYVDHTIQKCQDAIQGELVLIRKRFIDVANGLLDDKPDLPSIRAASQLIHDHFPPIARVADVSDAPPFEDLSDLPDAELDKMRAIRDTARASQSSIIVVAPGSHSAEVAVFARSSCWVPCLVA